MSMNTKEWLRLQYWDDFNKKPTLMGIWWKSAIDKRTKDTILLWAKRAKRYNYTYDDCYRFFWTALAITHFVEIANKVWKRR